VSDEREPHVDDVLGSVRQLEESLEATSTARAASEARLKQARTDASSLLAAAREAAAAATAERRRVVLAAAGDDAAEIHRRGEQDAARLRAEAQVSCDAAVEAALALILPARDKSED
jgi:vacuolar-type H+-ATPase subunit H